jgi:nucleoside 2-deoxyribosyltransferase
MEEQIMKNQYVGDISDYRKYTLLKCVADTGLKLGVNWYLTPEDGGSDGLKRAYLKSIPRKYRQDEKLFDLLQDTCDKPELRNVEQIEKRGVLDGTSKTLFFSEELPKHTTAETAERRKWDERAKKMLNECDIVFLDPDNGLQIDSGSSFEKFATIDEVVSYVKAGKSVILYQYNQQRSSHSNIEDANCKKEQKLRNATKSYGSDVIVFRVPSVTFFIIFRESHKPNIESAIVKYKESVAPKHWR